VGEQAPQRIKLLVNRPNIGFEDVEEAEEPEVAQILEISEDDVKEGRPIALRFVRFQTVTSLHASPVFLPASSWHSTVSRFLLPPTKAARRRHA
jgi:hypothetical protein